MIKQETFATSVPIRFPRVDWDNAGRYQRWMLKFLALSLLILPQAFTLEVCTLNDLLDPLTQKVDYLRPCSTFESARILESSYMHVEVVLKKNEVKNRIVIHTSSKRVSVRLVSMLFGGEFELQLLERVYLFGNENNTFTSFINDASIIEEEDSQYIWCKIRVLKPKTQKFSYQEKHLGKVLGFYFGDREENDF